MIEFERTYWKHNFGIDIFTFVKFSNSKSSYGLLVNVQKDNVMLFSNTLMSPGNFDGLGANIERELRRHKSKYVFQGIMFVIAGLLAAAFPASTAINVELIIGAILFVSGLFQFGLSIKSKMPWWALFSAGLSMGIGLILLVHPLPVLMAFITILAIFMTIEGTLEILLSFQFRPARNWNWMFISGIVTLVLAAALWVGSPLFDVLYVGWVIAINLICYGISLLMLVGAQQHQ